MIAFKYTVSLLLLSLSVSLGMAQIKAGKIVYERKTNLYKKFQDESMGRWLGDANKIKIEDFELYFNDTASVFLPQVNDVPDNMSWLTSQNTAYQNYKTHQRLSIKSLAESVYIEDTLWTRKWKITDSKRVIAGFTCRKALWEANDSTRIYAWYCDDIVPEVGPESFYGLPGAILGLATEDGGVVYFAKTVDIKTLPDNNILTPKVGKNKVYHTPEVRKNLEQQFGRFPWGKLMMHDLFDLW